MLVRYAVKVARTVLRGWSGSNAAPLPDNPGNLRLGFRTAGRFACAFWMAGSELGQFPVS